MSVYYEMGKQLLREGNISEASRLFEEDINSGGVNGYYGKLLVSDTQLDEFAFNEQLKIVFSEHKDRFIKSASEGDCDSAFICGLYYSLNKRTSQKSHLFFCLLLLWGTKWLSIILP